MAIPPPDPPPPTWDSTEFASAQSDCNTYGYDSTNLAVNGKGGVTQYLYAGKGASTGTLKWFLRESSNSGSSPQGKIPQLTFDVVKNGTLDTQTSVITYGGHTYLMDLRDDGSGTQIAYAKQLT